MYAADYDKIKAQQAEFEKAWRPEVRNTEGQDDGGIWVDTMNRYRNLHSVLEGAFQRAAFGKGAERHARGNESFEEQYIIRGANSFGLGGPYFQIGKKLEECRNMTGDQRIKELQDIIIYAAAAIMVTEGAGAK